MFSKQCVNYIPFFFLPNTEYLCGSLFWKTSCHMGTVPPSKLPLGTRLMICGAIFVELYYRWRVYTAKFSNTFCWSGRCAVVQWRRPSTRRAIGLSKFTAKVHYKKDGGRALLRSPAHHAHPWHCPLSDILHSFTCIYIYKYNSLYYIRVILRYPIIINALYIVADTDNIINILYMRSGVRRFLII